MTPHRAELTSAVQKFIEAQPLFFVATAAPEGRVNLSPKGLDSLRVLSPNRIVWLSLSGSGNETAAHLRQSDRMTLMFCAFDGAPGIVRVYGKARAVHPRDAQWDELKDLFPALAGSRQIFDLSVEMVQRSCGTGIPVMPVQRSRGETELVPFYEEMDADGLKDYWARKNTVSIDGLPTGIFADGEG